MRIVRVGVGDENAVFAAAGLFDDEPTTDWLATFIESPIHHLLLAFVDDSEVAVGFVSGVETTHPDKGTEMFVYELAVDEAFRRRGIATALMAELQRIALEHGCYGMWVSTEPDNDAAIATYLAAGAQSPEPVVVLTWTF